MEKSIAIETASKEELLEEHEKCEQLWGMYSCDCFGFYITAIHKRINELGGFPPKK